MQYSITTFTAHICKIFLIFSILSVWYNIWLKYVLIVAPFGFWLSFNQSHICKMNKIPVSRIKLLFTTLQNRYTGMRISRIRPRLLPSRKRSPKSKRQPKMRSFIRSRARVRWRRILSVGGQDWIQEYEVPYSTCTKTYTCSFQIH